MLTTSAFLLPALPTMLIDEQRGDVTEMIEALAAAGRRLEAESPAAIVVVSPRWSSPDAFHADDGSRHRSVVDLPTFGVEPRYDCPGHPALARAIVAEATRRGVRATTARRGVDSGASVPLHFFARTRRVPIVPLSIGPGSRTEHRAWGEAVRFALAAWSEPVAFAVGGALSWNLHAFGLRRDVPECAELDERVVAALRAGRWDAIADVVDALGAKAQPEADLRHLDVLHGFLLIEHVAGAVLEREELPGLGTVMAEFPLPAVSGGAGR